jgi:hypothetical protein
MTQPGWPPDPVQFPKEWDTVLVAGVRSPGIATVGEFKSRGPWDEKKGKGQMFATLTYTGKNLRRGEITFLLRAGPNPSTPGQNYTDLQQWITFSALFQYDSSAKQVQAQAVAIYHPALKMINLTSVIAEDTPSPVRVRDGDTLYRVVLPLLEWAPTPKTPAVSTPTGAKANPPGSTNPPGRQPSPAVKALQDAIAAELAKRQTPA